jgi:hypothetical protein
MKTYGGDGSIAPWILKQHYMEVGGQLHGLASLPLGRQPPDPLNGKLGRLQSRFERCGAEKIYLVSDGN